MTAIRLETDPDTIDPIAYLSALNKKLEPVQATEECKILKPALLNLYQSDRATFAVAAELVKEKLGISRRDLEADIKSLLGGEEQDSKPLPLARFPELVDIVDEDGEVRFLVKSENGSGVHTEAQWEMDSKIYVPPAKNRIPWLLPRAGQVKAAYETDNAATLYTDLVAYYKSLVKLPTESHYKLLAVFSFHPYTLDFPGVTHSPELIFTGVPERGKSRTGKAITYAAMRGLRTETLREATIFRWSEDLGATIFFDVLDLWKKAEREKSEDILLNRFEKGEKAARVLYPEKGPFEDTRYFEIFGATIIATNEPVHKILDTRCLTITMPPAKRRFDTEPTPELGLPFRERLLAWRAHQMGKSLPELNKPHDGRLGDITLPLLKVIKLVAPREEEELRKLFASMETDRLNEKSRTLEGDILAALLKVENEVINCKVPLKRLVDKLNEERTEKEALTSRFVSSRLRSLGFQLTTRNPADIVWNRELLDCCLASYGILDPPRTLETSSQSSQPSQSSQNPLPEEAEKPQVPESVESNESVERQNRGGEGENKSEQKALFADSDKSRGHENGGGHLTRAGHPCRKPGCRLTPYGQECELSDEDRRRWEEEQAKAKKKVKDPEEGEI